MDACQCGLLIVAWLIAYFFPVDLIVLAYVVLGPLHYLTEIAWLDRRSYFLPKATDKWWLVGLTVAGALAAGWLAQRSSSSSSWIDYQIQFCAISVAMAALVISIVFRWTTNPQHRLRFTLLVIGGIAAFFYFNQTRNYHLFFAVLVPTLIHVFIFSVLFMFAGALKNRSRLGVLSVVMFVLGGFFLLFTGGQTDRPFTNSLGLAYRDIFGYLENHLVGLLASQSRQRSSPSLVFHEPIARFLAFVYTYHYLNWFSKTTIIQWHRVSVKAGVVIAVLWLSSLIAFVVDRQIGLLLVGFLSLLHVFLEFPLNWASMTAIRSEVVAVCRNGWSVTEERFGNSRNLSRCTPSLVKRDI